MAGLGWLELISGRETWRERFVFDREGLGIALVLYLVVVLILTFVSGLMRGALPGYADTFWIVVVNAFPILLLSIVFRLTGLLLGLKAPFLVLIVPSVHALAYLLILSFLLSLMGGTFGPAILGMLGYMMYRLARLAAGMGILVSVAFAVLCVLALVALQLGLYMVTAPPTA